MVPLSMALVVLATLGVADTAFLSYQKFIGVVPGCHAGVFGCQTVLTSQWSSIGPISLSYLGLAYYLTALVLSVLIFLDKKHLRLTRNVLLHPHDLLLLLTSGGALMSLFLVSLMAFVLNAWCLFCLLSAFTSFGLFGLSVWLHHHKKGDCQKGCVTGKRLLLQLGYQWLVKPILFLFPAETVHEVMTCVGCMLGQYRLGRKLTRALFYVSNPGLTITRDGITFPNPVGLAAGFDYEAQLTDILPDVGYGFMTVGTVTLRSYSGNPSPRLGRFPKSQSLLVNKGFRSPGAKGIIRRLSGKRFRIPVGISIGSTNAPYSSLKAQVKDIIECFTMFENSRVRHAYYELNISCPNTQNGQPFTTPDRLVQLLSAVDRLEIKRPIYLKMPIDLSPQATLALLTVAAKHDIQGMVFGNLTKDKQNPDVNEQDRLLWQRSPGNLSGKPTWNRSNALIKLTRENFGSRFTIIGTGGIFSPADAKTKLELGADVVQLISGMVYQGPQLIGAINQYLSPKPISSATMSGYGSQAVSPAPSH